MELTLDNPGLPASLWTALDGKLWHATGVQGLEGIIIDREIKVFLERYNKSLCKMLNGVSLIDFGPSATHYPHQFNNWNGRARNRLVALALLFTGGIPELKERQFRIGYEIERLESLIRSHWSSRNP
jgi:hypothetical protein